MLGAGSLAVTGLCLLRLAFCTFLGVGLFRLALLALGLPGFVALARFALARFALLLALPLLVLTLLALTSLALPLLALPLLALALLACTLAVLLTVAALSVTRFAFAGRAGALRRRGAAERIGLLFAGRGPVAQRVQKAVQRLGVAGTTSFGSRCAVARRAEVVERRRGRGVLGCLRCRVGRVLRILEPRLFQYRVGGVGAFRGGRGGGVRSCDGERSAPDFRRGSPAAGPGLSQ